MSWWNKVRRRRDPVRQAHIPDEDDYVFRRSRTITGTTSVRVTAAAESQQSRLLSARLKLADLRRHQRIMAVALAGIVMMGGLVVWLLDQYVASTTVLSADKHVLQLSDGDKVRLEEVTQQYLNARPAERFRFLMNSQRYQEYILQQVPEVASVTMGGDRGLIATRTTFRMRQPLARWQIDRTVYYVDASGTTFQRNYYAEPSVAVQDDSGAQAAHSGELVASNHLLAFLGQLVGGINASGIGTVQTVTIPPATLRELRVTVSGLTYPIKTHTDRESSEQVEDIVTVVKHLQGKRITPKYVDVRVPGRAYYQ